MRGTRMARQMPPAGRCRAAKEPSRSCTFARTLWCPISRAGAASGCLSTPAPESTVRVRSGRLLPAPRPGLAGEPSGTVTALVDHRRDPSRQRRVLRARRSACGPRRARTWSPGLEGPHGRPTVAPRFEQVYVQFREARTFAVSDLSARLHIKAHAPQYTPTTPSLECPSSCAIVRRAAVSICRFVPVSERRGGPPTAGAFQPVSSS